MQLAKLASALHLFSCSDKLHNARAIVPDRINEDPSVVTNRKTPPAKALEAAVSQMEALSQSAW